MKKALTNFFNKVKNIFAKSPALALLFIIILLSLLYDYQVILFLRPQSHHAPRQSDCLSFALNYYRGGMDFFHPFIHLCNNAGSYKGITEFPILYYTAAILWKIFGYHEYIFRLLGLTIFFSSLFALQKIGLRLFKNIFWATWLPAFVFTSTIITYYANNFLSDVPALSLSIWGWYFFLKFYDSGSKKQFYFSILFFLLAALLKISAGISITAIGIIFLTELFGKKNFGPDEKKLFPQRVHYFIGFTIYMLVLASWYHYADVYSYENHNELLLKGILPVWEMDKGSFWNTTSLLYAKLDHELFNIGGFFLSLGLLLLIIVKRRSIPRFFGTATILMFVFFLIYIVLFYQVFDVHDYYLINMYIVFIFIFISGIYLITKRPGKFNPPILIKTVATLYLCWSAYECAVKLRWRYFRDDPIAEGSFLLNTEEKNFYSWYHWYHEAYKSAYETIEPYNRSLGIKREDKVICIQDDDEVSLYLMDQKGYTSFGVPRESKEVIDAYIKYGAKYLFISDTAICTKEFIKPFLEKRLGSYKNIVIYDIRK